MSNKIFTITEMAEIHNISRQTLIYYDRIGLFKPDNMDPKTSYRYYSAHQIPVLREICFLKSIGVKLEEIKKHMNERNVNTTISLLEQQKHLVTTEIQSLLKTQMYINQKLSIYNDVTAYSDQLDKPNIKFFKQREAVFVPFECNISKGNLHITYMKAWDVLLKNSILPSKEFGTVIMKDQLFQDNTFSNAGVFICLPFSNPDLITSIILPEGEYACMYKHGMPYKSEHLYRLVSWIDENNYVINGNIFDTCLLDSTFTIDGKHKNFCEIQIPIKLN